MKYPVPFGVVLGNIQRLDQFSWQKLLLSNCLEEIIENLLCPQLEEIDTDGAAICSESLNTELLQSMFSN